MVKYKHLKRIQMEKIDTKDETFSTNFMPNLERLRLSIIEIGLIQPVILREKMDGFQIISGFRRISVLRELGIEEVDSIIFEEDEDEKDFFILALHENIMGRGLNIVEKAIAIEKLINQFRIDPFTVIHKFLPLFDLETNEKILNTYLSLARMEEEVKVYVLNEKVSHSNIRRLATFNSEDRSGLIQFLTRLKLGENRLKEILLLLSEISKRDGISIRDIIKKPEIETIVSDDGFTPSQRTERVKKALMRMRYPTWFKKEEEFQRKLKELNLPIGVSLQHSDFFEGRELKVSFQFETAEEYNSLISTLATIGNREEFKEIMEIG